MPRLRKQDLVADREEPTEEATPPTVSPTSLVSITKVEGPTTTLAKRKPSKLPVPIQFPLIAILSLSLSAVGYSLTHQWTKGVIATHARALDSYTDIGILTGWRVFELALGWFGNYDSYDLAALNLLSHGPPLYLLSAFYNTPSSALLLTLAIETLSTFIPFRLLRPLSAAHGDPSHAPNADLLTDRPIALLTTLLSGAIYTVTLFAAYKTYLPTALITHFNDLPSLVAAHEATYVNLLPVGLVLGFAATVFIFTPAEAEEEGDKSIAFDPVQASLKETVWWNVWGWSRRAKVVIKRTLVLVLVTGGNTALQTLYTINGADAKGAVAWASVWAVAAAVTGLGLGAVGSV